MSQIINIIYDKQEKGNAGWSYRIEDGASGAIDGQAADAIDRVCESMEAHEGDREAILEAVGAEAGDQLWLDLGATAYIDLAALYDLDA